MIITPTFTTNFDTNFGANATAARAAWVAAAQVFTSHFSDSININITVDAAAGTNVFGQSSTPLLSISYADLLAAFTADATTQNDQIAIGPGGSMTAADPTNGTGTWWLTRSQAKALGHIPDDMSGDGTTTFGAGNPFTFSGAITAGTFDFQGIAAHEISEVMGRLGLSGGSVGTTANSFSLIDNFSYTGPGTKGLRGGPGNNFSIDNGTTLLKLFNDPTVNHLDSRDWAPGTNDAFNQFSDPSVVNPVSAVDLQLMDVLGYNLIPTFALGPSIQYDTGGPNAVALDDNGNVAEVHVGTNRLFHRVGTVNFTNQTIAWGPSIQYDTGGPNAVALDDHGNAVEVHVGTNRLFYRVGTVNFTNQTIAWGPSIQYDTGGPNAVALDDHGNAVEVHVGTNRLFYRVGTVNFTNQTIAWGPSIQYDTGGPNAVALDDHGNVGRGPRRHQQALLPGRDR